MKPRTAPDPERVRIHAGIKVDLANYGQEPRHKPAYRVVKAFWDENWSKGLPPEWEERFIETIDDGELQGDWRIYIVDVAGIWMGFTESINGKSLVLMTLHPTDLVLPNQIVRMIRDRMRHI